VFCAEASEHAEARRTGLHPVEQTEGREDDQDSDEHELPAAVDGLEPDGCRHSDRTTAHECKQGQRRCRQRIAPSEGQGEQQRKRDEGRQIVVSHTQDQRARDGPLGLDLAERDERGTRCGRDGQGRRHDGQAPVSAAGIDRHGDEKAREPDLGAGEDEGLVPDASEDLETELCADAEQDEADRELLHGLQRRLCGGPEQEEIRRASLVEQSQQRVGSEGQADEQIGADARDADARGQPPECQACQQRERQGDQARKEVLQAPPSTERPRRPSIQAAGDPGRDGGTPPPWPVRQGIGPGAQAPGTRRRLYGICESELRSDSQAPRRMAHDSSWAIRRRKGPAQRDRC
jgi:hypothetical protein